jgi:hypothetical protein
MARGSFAPSVLADVGQSNALPALTSSAMPRRRWKAALSRPEVREAISKVGNVSQYPLMAEPY